MTVAPAAAMSSEDNLSQLQELVSKGEKRGVFNDSMPSIIQRSVRREEGSEGGREGGRDGREGGRGGREGRKYSVIPYILVCIK